MPRVADLVVPHLPPVDVEDPAAFVSAWRQFHHAAQAVALVGKRWGEARDDDAHSALVPAFSDDEPPAGGPFVSPDRTGSVRGELCFADPLCGAAISLSRLRPLGERRVISLGGRRIGDLTDAVNETVGGWLGAERQPAVPAPDLPEHSVARGEAFDGLELEAVGPDLEAAYVATAMMLDRLGEHLAASDDIGADEADEDAAAPRLWPHHFDLASLFVLRRDGGGAMTRTIGVGLTPPDDVEGAGSWYVSGWASEPVAAGAPPGLPFGRWHHRDGGVPPLAVPPMAVLPVSEVAGERDAERQPVILAEFIAAALNATRGMLS